jgi:hypothetical protein
VVHFNNSQFKNILIKDIIFIDYENKNHYKLLTPKKNFIIDRINKKTFPKYKQIIMIKNNNNNLIKQQQEKKRKS